MLHLSHNVYNIHVYRPEWYRQVGALDHIDQ